MAIIDTVVVTYPRNEVILNDTIRQLLEVKSYIVTHCFKDFSVNIKRVEEFNKTYDQLLNKFFDLCEHKIRTLDIYWLVFFNELLISPTTDMLKSAKTFCQAEFATIGPFLDNVFPEIKSPLPRPKTLFVSLRNIPLKDVGPWGGAYGTFPKGIAVETTGYPESVYHEYLHLVGASEGYKKETKVTCEGCNNCWMQFDSTKGKGLCGRHAKDLSDFLSDI